MEDQQLVHRNHWFNLQRAKGLPLGASAWGSKIEALGMVLLLEGIMTFVPGLVLPSAALVEILFINAVYSACRLQIR